ncbi:MAG: RrF2 family transcriptional regulator [Planctomycetota bacterium]|jgi:Rrf2 family protein
MNIVRQNTDYAFRALVNLARRYGRDVISTKVLAEEEDISYQFACKILQKLQSAKLVRSTMGPKGGYYLSKPPARVSLLEVIEAVQGPISMNKCLHAEDACNRKPNCGVSEKLTELQEYVVSFLRGVTLDEFLENGGPEQKAATKNLKGRRNGQQKRKSKRA